MELSGILTVQALCVFSSCFFLLLVITGAHRLLVIVRNSPGSIKKNSNMNPRLPGYISILCLVFYVLKSLLGIARQRSRKKFAIFVRMLDIERNY